MIIGLTLVTVLGPAILDGRRPENARGEGDAGVVRQPDRQEAEHRRRMIVPPPDIDTVILVLGFFQGTPFVCFYIQDDNVAAVTVCGPKVPGKFPVMKTQKFCRRSAKPVEKDGVGF